MKMHKKPKSQYEKHLNDLGIPEDDKKENGGRINGWAKYGTWLRKHDPIAFNVGYDEWANKY